MNEEMNFEDAMKRLEEIVRALENPELGLAASLALYREGSACAGLCRKMLTEARHELEAWGEEENLEEAVE